MAAAMQMAEKKVSHPRQGAVTVMAPRKTKAQILVYLDPAPLGLLADHAARRDRPQSLIAEAAIASFLSPDLEHRVRVERQVAVAAPDLLQREISFASAAPLALVATSADHYG